jgi:hypothetical protein
MEYNWIKSLTGLLHPKMNVNFEIQYNNLLKAKIKESLDKKEISIFKIIFYVKNVYHRQRCCHARALLSGKHRCRS